MKKEINQNQHSLSNNKVSKIEKSFRHEITKATGDYLSEELEKYRHLTIIVEENKDNKE